MLILIVSLLFFLSGCDFFDWHKTVKSHIELGDDQSKTIWLFLSGLTSDFYSSEQLKMRQDLDTLGKKNNIKFLAIIPPARCEQFDNKLCWPHDTKDQT